MRKTLFGGLVLSRGPIFSMGGLIFSLVKSLIFEIKKHLFQNFILENQIFKYIRFFTIFQV